LPCHTFLPQTGGNSSLPDAPSPDFGANVTQAARSLAAAIRAIHLYPAPTATENSSILRDHALEQVTIDAEV
jgi:hypothetical protein